MRFTNLLTLLVLLATTSSIAYSIKREDQNGSTDTIDSFPYQRVPTSNIGAANKDEIDDSIIDETNDSKSGTVQIKIGSISLATLALVLHLF